MECSNLELGFLNWVDCNLFAYQAGYPFDPIERTGREILEQSQLYNVDNMRIFFLEIRRPIRYLLGCVDEPLDWTELQSFVVEHGNSSGNIALSLAALVGSSWVSSLDNWNLQQEHLISCSLTGLTNHHAP
jgi:hypothetical protein